MATNKSIRDFFKPKPPAGLPAASATTSSQTASRLNPPTSPLAIRSSPKKEPSSVDMGQRSARMSAEPAGYTSGSLSPPLSTDTSDAFHTPQGEGESPNSISPDIHHLTKDEDSPSSSPFRATPTPPKEPAPKVALARDRVIENSDDEDEDSDSSLEDLSALLASKTAGTRARRETARLTPSTPPAPRFRNAIGFQVSPLAVMPKYKFDLSSLAKHSRIDNATEASSKRMKAMMTSTKEDEDDQMTANENVTNPRSFDPEALLESVVGEDGGASKVRRALRRTEATISETRWYFFDTQANPLKRPKKSFPTGSTLGNWKSELSDPQMRYHNFTSGFAEDLVSMGKQLPDELFMYILDQLCLEHDEPLRTSYVNVLTQSTKQVSRLMTPTMIQKLFCDLGTSSSGTTISEKIKLVPRLSDPYSNRRWQHLIAVLKFITGAAETMTQVSRTFAISMLLRMSLDRVVFQNVDILDSTQNAISKLCKYISEEEWEPACQEICKELFTVVEPPTLRIQVVQCIPSTTPRSHDLRRRLAMCFFFNTLTYSTTHSYNLMDLNVFISRLDDPAFDTTPETDYRDLASLISILDVAIDDGRSTSLDLSSKAMETKFNNDVEGLGAAIKDIMRNIGNPGAAFISRIEAKEVLELVEQRIRDTVRTKPKPKSTWFDVKTKEEDLEVERAGMKSYLAKVKGIGNGEGSK